MLRFTNSGLNPRSVYSDAVLQVIIALPGIMAPPPPFAIPPPLLQSPTPHTIDRAELYGVPTAVENKMPGVPLHVVTDSEAVYAGLMGKSAKWEQHGWVGSRGLLAHQDLWELLWCSWQLLGDTVSVQ